VLGKKVYTEKLSAFSGAYKKPISLVGEANGMYFIEISSGEKRSTSKLIIE
jgi:hypothetical protein